MKVGSLFSGIGGLDLGLERAGMTIRWQVENDPYCQRVLAKHWPSAKRYGDIKTIDWTEVELVDLICGGFPCQPVSLAGKRLAQADERWLWPEFARAVRVLRPRYVLVENVPGLLSAGLSDVLGDLAALGYNAEWDCIPAAAVGAPHLRYRVWIVANAHEGRCWPNGLFGGLAGVGRGRQDHSMPTTESSVVAYPEGVGRLARRACDPEEVKKWGESHRGGIGFIFPDPNREPPFWLAESWNQCGFWATEPDVGRVAHGVPARVDRLRGLGNAVVPQVAEWIGRRVINTRNEEDRDG